jgi:hypothetical protein
MPLPLHPQGQSGWMWQILHLPWLNPWTIQPISSHYTDYTHPVYDTNNTECEIPYYFQKLFSSKCLKYLLKLSHWMCPCYCLCCEHNNETWTKTTLFHGSKISDLNQYGTQQLEGKDYRSSPITRLTNITETVVRMHTYESPVQLVRLNKKSCQQHTA